MKPMRKRVNRMNEMPFPLNQVFIVYNPDKIQAYEYTKQVESKLQQAGIQTYLCSHLPLTPQDQYQFIDYGKKCDAVVVLGGDGTILGVVRQLAQFPKPLLGINLGGFGFLTSCTTNELDQAIQYLIEKKWQVQNRHLLEVRVVRNHEETHEIIFESLALNEALVTRSQPGRLMEIWLGETRESALSYRADGLILSTATGSTGHSLSAGGPILEPNLAALIITPVSPHSLFNRPLVFGGEREMHIWFNTDAEELLLILDGQIRTPLHALDEVTIRRSSQVFPTISMPGRSFSEVLRYKFNLRGTP